MVLAEAGGLLPLMRKLRALGATSVNVSRDAVYVTLSDRVHVPMPTAEEQLLSEEQREDAARKDALTDEAWSS